MSNRRQAHTTFPDVAVNARLTWPSLTLLKSLSLSVSVSALYSSISLVAPTQLLSYPHRQRLFRQSVRQVTLFFVLVSFIDLFRKIYFRNIIGGLRVHGRGQGSGFAFYRLTTNFSLLTQPTLS